MTMRHVDRCLQSRRQTILRPRQGQHKSVICIIFSRLRFSIAPLGGQRPRRLSSSPNGSTDPRCLCRPTFHLRNRFLTVTSSTANALGHRLVDRQATRGSCNTGLHTHTHTHIEDTY